MAHLTEEPDVEPIHKQVQHLVSRAIAQGQGRPIGLRFSIDGYRDAMSQSVPGMDPWGSPRHAPTHYLGLPFERVRDQVDPVEIVCEGED